MENVPKEAKTAQSSGVSHSKTESTRLKALWVGFIPEKVLDLSWAGLSAHTVTSPLASVCKLTGDVMS